MTREFEHVPDEVKSLVETGIFWMAYTHLTPSFSRTGIEKTGKIQSQMLANDAGVVPMTGEFMAGGPIPPWASMIFRMTTVSVSDYASTEHSWKHYLGLQRWDPKSSDKIVEYLQEEIVKMEETPKGYLDFLIEWGFVDPTHTNSRGDILIRMRECIRYEQLRQERYAEMGAEERSALENSGVDVYVFGSKLRRAITGKWCGRHVRVEHPFVEAGEIKLNRYLLGMFTTEDVSETKVWVDGVSQRDIPVGSLDALATWEEMITKLPNFTPSYANMRTLVHPVRKDRLEEKHALRQQVIDDVLAYQD